MANTIIQCYCPRPKAKVYKHTTASYPLPYKGASHQFRVECDSCKVKGRFFTDKKPAIDFWNKMMESADKLHERKMNIFRQTPTKDLLRDALGEFDDPKNKNNE